VISKNIVYLVLFLCLIQSMFLIGKDSQQAKVYEVEPIIGFSSQCATENINSEVTFDIFVYNRSTAEDLLVLFCNNPDIAKQFGSVKATWGVTAPAMMEKVGNGFADLTRAKQQIIDALSATETHGYTQIATYPNYRVFLIARNEKPSVSKEYLLDKTFGLIDYPTSRSGHIVPKQILADLGLSLDKMSIVYASSHAELRELLAAGKVDVISSYWSDVDNERFSYSYTQQIESEVSGTNWYLKMENDNTVLFCAVQQILLQYSESQNSSYYNRLELANDGVCL
jgi:phosphonate transport system substrate-binding protein